ncbi:MAG: F0F1 ATP synthase subunit alpha, partial [Rhodobacteraceae bacterium]|nr:F0F1 ATP synthase subunit alpha [Paracoccaceae bacterium]
RQPQNAPLRLGDEVALMLAVQSGALDALPLEIVTRFRAALPAALDRDAADALDSLAKTGALSDTARAAFKAAIARLAASLGDADPAP